MSKVIMILLFISFRSYAEGKFMTGVGYIKPADYRVDNEINPLPLGLSLVPMIAYRGDRLNVIGPNISYALLKGAIGLSLGVNASGDRYKARNLKQRETAINGAVNLRLLFLTLSHGVDISHVYHGNIYKAGLGWRFVLTDSLSFTPNMSKEFLSKEYANYYYGISSKEIGYFPSYEIQSAVNDTFGGGLSYSLSEESILSLNYSYKVFDQVIYESPTVNKKSYETWSIFWTYIL